jgi:Gas vesicle synthesis protein GvpL/GvpF
MAGQWIEGRPPSEVTRVAGELAREALDEAADRAREIMVERLTASLVAEGERSLEEAKDASRSCYVYCITRASGAPLPQLSGFDETTGIEELVEGPLAAVFCLVAPRVFEGLADEHVAPDSRVARLAFRHDEIVRRVFEARPVLPLRFGTMVATRTDAAALLARGCDRFLSELERIENRHEWTCHICADLNAVTEARPAAGRSHAAGGAQYLAARDEELRHEGTERQHLDEAARTVHDAVEKHVEAAVPLYPTQDERRTAYLVPTERERSFRDAVKRVGSRVTGARIELLGPLPPYHFVDIELEADHRWTTAEG